MEIRQLKSFWVVAERLSFHRAAQELNYAQSSISAQVMALEEELGVRLFDRLGRRVQLTPAGEALLPYAAKMLDLAAAARAEVTEEKQAAGSLTIRVPESFCVHRLPAVVARFRRRMPRVRLGFITCAQEGLRRDLQKGVTDLAFLLADSLAAADLCVQALGTERLVLVAPPGHRLAGVRGLALAELAGETLLLSRVDCSYRRLLEAELTAAGVAPGLVLEFNSVAAIITHVRAGLGLTLLPEVAARAELKRGGLAALAWPEEGLETACLMVWHRDKWLSPALTGFMAAAREVLLEGASQ